MLCKSILCLHCFRRIAAGKVYFGCVANNCDLVPAQSGKRLFRPKLSQRLADSYYQIRPYAICPYFARNRHCFTQFSLNRYCPDCLSPLHQQAGLRPETIIAVVGPVASGKTEYLRSLKQSLSRYFGLQRIQFEINRAPDWDTDLNREAGPSAQGCKYPPQVYLLSHQGQDGGLRTCLLAFFDVAGGDWLELNRHNLRFLPFCAGLIVACDPLANPKVLKILLTSAHYAQNPNLETFLATRLHRLEHSQIAQLKPIIEPILADFKALGRKIPLALTITKSDLLRHPHLLYHKDDRFAAIHLNDENPLDIDERASEAARWYMQNFEPELYQLLENSYLNRDMVNYFAVSALGEAPQAGIIGNRQPVRIADPYLWCLQRLNLL